MRAADLGRGIEAGEIDPAELAETFLAAIKAHPAAPRIYVRVTTDRARDEAHAARGRARSGMRRSPLDGVPVSWKDLFDMSGVATESGSKLLKGRVPRRDAAVLRNATRAGLVSLGKTHQTELAFSGLGLNPVTASPPCVHDPEAVSGGSSSGAAASVAFGLAAAGIGSDTGGSVRIPSAWNDLVGLKTAWGRLSLEGVVPLCPRFDTVGPLCRSVEDSALLMAALEGVRPMDLGELTLAGVKLAVLRTAAFDGIEDEPRNAFESAVERLRAAGAQVADIEVPLVEEAMALAPILFPAEAYDTWKERIEAEGDLMYPPVRKRFLQGRSVTADSLRAAWQKLDALREAYRDASSGFDAMILPSVPIRPPKAGPLLADEEAFTHANLRALQNTRVGNLMGLAALTLPTGVASCGLMLQGSREEDVLRLGLAAETALS
ncbi:MAG: amidase [Boseongicola sp. SB0676_bin_33]|nr:amidase [Boseongicola sp. SB0676_bin_33]MYK33353.1 amidase [Boseongicola sp. SB0670_bin_30]